MSEHPHARAYMTPEIQDEILTRISDGESLLRICGPGRTPGMPNRVTVHRRLREDRAFRQAYLTARQMQAAHIAEEILEIADGRAPEPGQAPSVGRDWLRVSARQWLAGVMAPRTYSAQRAAQDELERLEKRAEQEDRKAEDLALIHARVEKDYAEAKERRRLGLPQEGLWEDLDEEDWAALEAEEAGGA